MTKAHRLATLKWRIRTLVLLPLVVTAVWAQEWDVGSRLATAISEGSDNKFKLSFEQRGRYEDRSGNNFGKDVDVATGLYRTRLGLTYTPVKWLRFSGMVQDSRAPWYGTGAPNTMRDQADLHEGYMELFPAYKRGFGMTAGRMMLNYGEGRLIGTPQWGNLSRTYDHARAYWRSRKAQFEVLLVSPVKVRTGEFNHPMLGDRVWGTYNVFPDFYRKNLLEAYVLRRDQNRPGGFTGGSAKDGTDKLGVNTFGFRMTGPLASGVKYSLEGALQKGKVGPADLSAGAWFGGLSRRWTVARLPLDVSGEYKYASGTRNPADATHTGTFDQLYAANHDKFGHQDLFGWRNLHNARSVTTLGLSKSLALNFMYDNYWLASLEDAVYSGSGKLIARSANGTAGRHVGQETDIYGTYKYKHFTFGAGYGHFFTGQFIQKTTPGIGPTYLYVFHTYSL
ncbi:MAG TPA: alginate export family protein [Bryobacteraceae bacterium]